ncbi:hypothetical protein JI58_03995 [Marinosulfonomonas sp. PRT-SC04]|nr:hypothetical protein JI58_03995 [Marinosulfonomonas sp. PRT-SC04]
MFLAIRFFWFTRLFLRCSGWIAVLPLLVGAALTISAITLTKNAALISDHGVLATATLLAKPNTPSHVNHTHISQRSAASYSIQFQFTPQNSTEPITGKARVTATFYRSVSMEHKFVLRYLPENPFIYELGAGALKKQATIIQIIGLAFSVIGFAACIWFSSSALRALKARESVGMIIDTYVSRRVYWPPIFNRMQYQLGDAAAAKQHKTFIRPIWAYHGLKRGQKIRVALTGQGPY